MKNKSYRRPAICYKEQLQREWNKMRYMDGMFYYTGTPDNEELYITDSSALPGGSYRYQWVAVDDNGNVVGFIDYTLDTRKKSANNFGIYSFCKSPYFGAALKECLDEIIYKFKPHRMDWRMIAGNPVEKHYDKFCNYYNGNKYVLKDACMDIYGNYHDDIIYEIIDPWKIDTSKKHDDRPDSMRKSIDSSLFKDIALLGSDKHTISVINSDKEEGTKYEPLNIEMKLECADPDNFSDDSDYEFTESLSIATKCLSVFSKWFLDNEISDDWNTMKEIVSKLLIDINDATNNGAETKYDFNIYDIIGSVRAKALSTIEKFIRSTYQLTRLTKAEEGKYEGYNNNKKTGELCIRPETGGNEVYDIPHSVLIKDMYSNPEVVGALICIIILGIDPAIARINKDGSEDTSNSDYSERAYKTLSALIDIAYNISLCDSKKFESAHITNYLKCLVNGITSNFEDVQFSIIRSNIKGTTEGDYTIISIIFKKD